MTCPIMLRKFGGFCYRNAPTILAGGATIGVVATAIFAAKEKTRADELLEQYKAKQKAHGEEEKWFEKVKTVAPVYLPAALAGAATIACIVGGARISAGRLAVVTSLATSSEVALKKLNDKVVEIAGEKKAEDIQAALTRERTKDISVPEEDDEDVTCTTGGSALFFDEWSGRYFRSSRQAIDRAVNETNKIIMTGPLMYNDINSFYAKLGLRDVRNGDHLVWDIDHMLDIIYTGGISEKGEPYAIMTFVHDPHPEYCRY